MSLRNETLNTTETKFVQILVFFLFCTKRENHLFIKEQNIKLEVIGFSWKFST